MEKIRSDVLPELSHAIIGCAMRVHTALGPGLLESVYEECLSCELTKLGIKHQCQVRVPVTYAERELECGFRIDILVEGKVVVEIKTVDEILPVHESQLLTYLKMARKPLGLLINFDVQHLRHGIRRRVHTMVQSPTSPVHGPS